MYVARFYNPTILAFCHLDDRSDLRKFCILSALESLLRRDDNVVVCCSFFIHLEESCLQFIKYQKMISEIAVLYIKPGERNNFEKDFALAVQYIACIEGYIRHKLQRCLENQNKYVLLVDWEDIESHTIGFRTSETYVKWKELLHHYYDPFPIVEHFHTVIENKR